EGAADFIVLEAIVAERVDECTHATTRGGHVTGEGAGAASDADESTRALAKLEEAFVFELVVGFGDGVGADDELFGEGADAGKLVTVGERAGFGGVADLLHELEIEGRAGGGRELEKHTVMVEGYSDTATDVKREVNDNPPQLAACHHNLPAGT